MTKLIFVLMAGLLCFIHVQADLSMAEAYAKNGEIKKAQFELYQISLRAMDGNPKAICEFGTMYKKEGYWIVQSDEKASKMWLKSAEMGYAPCQFNIGAAYLIGSGIEKDLSKAKYWLGKAKDSTYTKYANLSQQLYKIHELDKY
jgi:hypothetical protein